jgi:predicted RNA binding protein YcfA (HicA-like mRNA interferase family)
MSKIEKLLIKILRANADNNVEFDEIVNILFRLGFEVRIKGSHHIFTKNGIDEILNLQPKDGKAKAYQVKQVREIIIKYRLDITQNEA